MPANKGVKTNVFLYVFVLYTVYISGQIIIFHGSLGRISLFQI